MSSYFGELFQLFLIKLNMCLPWIPAILFQSGVKRKYVLIKIYVWVFIATLFIITINWKPVNIYQQMIWWKMDNILCYIYISSYYFAIKMKKLMIHTTMWMNMQNKRRRKRMPTVWFFIHEIIEEAELIYCDQKLIGVCPGPCVSRVNCTGTWEKFSDDESKIFWL